MTSGGAPSQGCLDEAQLIALLERALSEEQAAQIEEHMDGCAGCRALVAELVRLRISACPADGGGEPAAPPADEAQGLLIAGRYRLIDPIGAGGMGVVYLAEDLRLSRKVAIKMMRATAAGDAPFAHEQLVREAQTLASLSHPGIVVVHDVGTCGEQVFMAMEFVRGTSLRLWLEQERPSLEAVLAIFRQVGRALHEAHQAGLLHQDFKPENVLVSPDGRARLSDFGLACAIGSRPTAREGRGALAGTPAYIAPEVYRGAAPGPRSDQFAFCVSLYEALYGEHPFSIARAEAPRAILRGALREPPPGRAVPGWLRAVVLRGLSPDPELSFSSMAELCRHLEHDVTQHQEPGAPMPPSRRAGPGVTRGMRRAIGRIRRRLGL